MAGSKILYFGNNDLSLPQFKPGGNDSKNRPEHLGGSQKMRVVFLLRLM